MNDNISKIVTTLTHNFNPVKLILFGSQAHGTATKNSDIDICIIAETINKRQTLIEMYYSLVDLSTPIDLLLYTPTEWNECIRDKFSFATQINLSGLVLFDATQ